MNYNLESTGLLVVDMQNDFCHPEGKLYAEASEKIIPTINGLIEEVVPRRVYFTKDTHFEGDSEFEQWGEHCLHGTWGHEIHEDIDTNTAKLSGTLAKDTYDAFHQTGFANDLQDDGIKEIVVCGTLANVCVQESATSAMLHGFDVAVVEDAIGYIEPSHKQNALAHMEFLGAEIVNSEELSESM